MKRSLRDITDKERSEILKLYPNMQTIKLADKFNLKKYSVENLAYRNNIRKSETYLQTRESGRIQKGERISPYSEFKKGNVPHNKGKKQSDYLTNPDALERTKATRFKKGNKPYNTGEVGEIRWRKDYHFIKLADNDWLELHRYVWQNKYGEIPPNHNVIFIDGNPKNCNIENLECVSNAELMKRNGITHYPKELQQLIKTNNKLIKQIKENEKTNRH